MASKQGDKEKEQESGKIATGNSFYRGQGSIGWEKKVNYPPAPIEKPE